MFYVRVWAELAGVACPDLRDARQPWLATTRIAIVYETLLGGGLPRTALPVLAMVAVALAALYGWGTSTLIGSLDAAPDDDRKRE